MNAKKLYTDLNKGKYYELYQWTTQSRIWEEKPREWYIGYSALFIFLVIIGLLIGQLIFVLAIIAFSFLWFTHAIIPPDIVVYQIMNSGIKFYDQLVRWSEIRHFWFSKKGDNILLHLDTYIEQANLEILFKRISILVPNENVMKEIFEILEGYIDYGDKVEVGFNFLTKLVHGEHVTMDTFIREN